MSDLTIGDYERALDDKRRLTRELDVALHGEEGAAKQASLCDLIGSAKQLRARLTSLQETNRRLVEALKPHMEILKDFEDRPDEEPASLCGPTGFGEREVSLGELRVARDLLSELEQDKSDDTRHP